MYTYFSKKVAYHLILLQFANERNDLTAIVHAKHRNDIILEKETTTLAKKLKFKNYL